MHNLLLVDDEHWILKDMEQIIDWEEAGFRLAGKANDAVAAESILRRQRIDVLVSDIRMPGKSGLDLLRFANRASPDTLVVFMSAYGEFAYAKQALEQGCFSYLLKPVNEAELLDTLDRCKRRLAERERERSGRQVAEQAMLFLEGIGKDLPIVRLLEGLVDFRPAFAPQSRVMFACVKAYGPLGLEGLAPLDELLEGEGISFYRSRVSSSKWCYMMELAVQLEADSAVRLYRAIRRLVKAKRWDVGLSAVCDASSRSGNVYHQAAMMADTSILAGRKGVHRYKSDVNGAVTGIRERIAKAAKPEQLKAILIDVHEGIKAGRIHLSGLAELYNSFMAAIDHLTSRLQPELTDSAYTQDMLLHCGNPQELLEEMAEQLEDRRQRQNGEPNAQLIVEDVVREVDLMYAHRISLKELARKHYISPNYLSHLFKQEKGQSFIHYLIRRRLEAAQALLEQDISLYEVARMVGYDDYAHFSKLFKKHLGQSPYDCKQHKKRQKEIKEGYMEKN